MVTRASLALVAWKTITHYPNLRAGQAIFNTAEELMPERARQLRGTEVDPFYNDDLIDAFMDALFAD